MRAGSHPFAGRSCRACGVLGLTLLAALPLAAERFEYPQEEFAERRRELCDAIEEPGTVVLFSSTRFPTGLRFRQDHDFYYLTGNEDLNGALALDAESCEAWLFLPTQTEREASRDGWNWLYQEEAPERCRSAR